MNKTKEISSNKKKTIKINRSPVTNNPQPPAMYDKSPVVQTPSGYVPQTYDK